MFSLDLCGQQTLSTVLGVWIKETVFETHFQDQYIAPNTNKSHMSMLTPESKFVTYLDTILSSLTHVDTSHYSFVQSV